MSAEMPPPEAPPAFQPDYRTAVLALRNAIAEALFMVGSDPTAPQDVSRDLGINRNMTWKLSHLIATNDLEAAFPKIPGPGAIKILIQALTQKGASAERLSAIVSTFAKFEQMVELHAGDRKTMELMLDGSAAVANEPLELSRKLAFQGSSGVWGCQARVRMRAVFLAPNESDPARLDFAQTSGLIDLVRFRPDAVWPFFQRTTFADDGSSLGHAEEDLISFDSSEDFKGPPLLRRYCSTELPKIHIQKTAKGFTYSLGAGPEGQAAKTTVIYGSGLRNFAPRYCDSINTWGECFLPINAPAENLLMDFYIHRDMASEVKLDAKLLLDKTQASRLRHSVELALPEPLRNLGAYPPLASTPLMPRHGDLVGDIFAHMGWSSTDFIGFRLEMKHPPVPATALLRYRLPKSPELSESLSA